MKDFVMNAAVRKISQEFSKLRMRSRLGSSNSEVDTDTSTESVCYASESSAKWSPFRRKGKQAVEDEAREISGLDLGRRYSRDENDQDIEVVKRQCSVNSMRPPLSRHSRSDLGTYPKLNLASVEESNQFSNKKPRKAKLKRHKSLTGILKATQESTNEDTKRDKKSRRKLKRSISFSGRFSNKHKGEGTKEFQRATAQKVNEKRSGRKENLLTSSSMSKSVSVDLEKKTVCNDSVSSTLSCGRDSEAKDVDNNSNAVMRRSSSAGNISTRFRSKKNVVPSMRLTLCRRNSFNGRLSIYDSFGQRLSMVETDLCSTEL